MSGPGGSSPLATLLFFPTVTTRTARRLAAARATVSCLQLSLGVARGGRTGAPLALRVLHSARGRGIIETSEREQEGRGHWGRGGWGGKCTGQRKWHAPQLRLGMGGSLGLGVLRPGGPVRRGRERAPRERERERREASETLVRFSKWCLQCIIPASGPGASPETKSRVSSLANLLSLSLAEYLSPSWGPTCFFRGGATQAGRRRPLEAPGADLSAALAEDSVLGRVLLDFNRLLAPAASSGGPRGRRRGRGHTHETSMHRHGPTSIASSPSPSCVKPQPSRASLPITNPVEVKST